MRRHEEPADEAHAGLGGQHREGRAEADFTALSATAAEEAVAKSDGELFAAALIPNSYYYPQSWVVIVRPGLDPDEHNTIRRVGVDRNSHDQTVLTEAEFPMADGYEYVDGNYTYMPAKIANGLLDAMVWHKSVLAIPLDAAGIGSRPLRDEWAVGLIEQMSTAVLVAKGTRPELSRLFDRLDWKSLGTIQEELSAGEIPPFY